MANEKTLEQLQAENEAYSKQVEALQDLSTRQATENDQLKKENTDLKSGLEQLQKELSYARLQHEHAEEVAIAAGKENEQLKSQISDLQAEVDVTNSVNEELTAKIEQLSSGKASDLGAAGEKAQARPKPILPTETFEVDGVKYKFTTPVFVHKMQRVEASKAITDTALLQELVEKKSGVITKA